MPEIKEEITIASEGAGVMRVKYTVVNTDGPVEVTVLAPVHAPHDHPATLAEIQRAAALAACDLLRAVTGQTETSPDTGE